MVAGSFTAAGGGKASFEFRLNMWLFGIHINFGFSAVFTLMGILKGLFSKAKGNMNTLPGAKRI